MAPEAAEFQPAPGAPARAHSTGQSGSASSKPRGCRPASPGSACPGSASSRPRVGVRTGPGSSPSRGCPGRPTISPILAGAACPPAPIV